jgi:hypothetical protein
VQIAALPHVVGVDASEACLGISDLLDRIHGLEYAHWQKTVTIARHMSGDQALRNTVAMGPNRHCFESINRISG